MNEPVIEGELVEVDPTPSYPTPEQRNVATKAPSPLPMRRATTLSALGAVLAVVGREIVPRVVSLLLDAWDRRSSQSAITSIRPDNTPNSSPLQTPSAGLGKGRRHRWRGRWS